jgi:hypothetical protein
MSVTTIDLQEWLDAFTDVAREYSTHHLRFDEKAPPATAGNGAARPAAYVAILGASSSIHLGLATTPDGAQRLTRAFLGLRGREAVAEHDVVDGMSEILNILAGKVKSRMSTRDRSLRLGLPMYVTGAVGHGEGIDKAVAELTMGMVPCQLQVFRQSRSA